MTNAVKNSQAAESATTGTIDMKAVNTVIARWPKEPRESAERLV
jgi:hypothetical protein